MIPCNKSKDCPGCVSSITHLFTGLPVDVLSELQRVKQVYRFSQGEKLYQVGEKAKGLFCIQEGTVKVEALSVDGKVHLQRIIPRGQIVGYRALISGHDYLATALAKEEVLACVIPVTDYMRMVKQHPSMMLKIMNRYNQELFIAEKRIESLMHKDSLERVAETLLYFKEHFPDPHWTRREFAEWAGTTTETVIRHFGKLEELGIILQSRDGISIVDRNRLIETANIFD